MGWTNRQAVALFRTSCEVLDASAFLSRPTAPHLAAFYLAIARPRSVGGLRSADPALSFAKLRSDKNQVQHLGSTFHAGSLQSL
jgi:hypothetical protein